MDIFPQDLFILALAGGSVATILAVVFGGFLWRLFVPLKPIPLRVEAWTRFEQRQWSASASMLRQLLSLGIGIVLVGGTVFVPVLVGVAEDASWYVNEWWIGVFFGALIVSIVCAYLIAGRAPDRCPRCRSAQLEKAMTRDETWIYVCSACKIVWRTTFSTRPSDMV